MIVTGGNSGLGYACARELADAGWYVVIAARDAKKSFNAVQSIAAASRNATVEALPLDLGSLTHIRGFAKRLEHTDRPPLNAIICNAGVQNGTIAHALPMATSNLSALITWATSCSSTCCCPGWLQVGASSLSAAQHTIRPAAQACRHRASRKHD